MAKTIAKSTSQRASKKSGVSVPGSIEEAAALEAEIANKLNEIERIKSRTALATARLEAMAETKTAPLISETAALAERLYAFAHSNRLQLTDGGKTKTVILGNAGLIQWQTSPHAAKITDEAAVLLRLHQLNLSDFIRQPPAEIDREAMLLTESSREQAAAVEGVTIRQDEKVYVRPAGSRAHLESILGKKGPGKWKSVWPKDVEEET